MLARVACTLFLCLVMSFAASAELRYKVAWETTTSGGFSAPSVLFDSNTGKATAIVAAGGDTGVVCYDLHGNQLWTYPMVPPVTAAPAVADIDGNGVEDVVAADSEGNVAALTKDGDVFLCMEPSQAYALRKYIKDYHNQQVTLLGLWSTQRRPYLQDPYGLSDKYWDTCLDIIDSALENIAHMLPK